MLLAQTPTLANYLFHLHIKALVEKEYAQSKCTYVQFTATRLTEFKKLVNAIQKTAQNQLSATDLKQWNENNTLISEIHRLWKNVREKDRLQQHRRKQKLTAARTFEEKKP
jgi:hypothetical protein